MALSDSCHVWLRTSFPTTGGARGPVIQSMSFFLGIGIITPVRMLAVLGLRTPLLNLVVHIPWCLWGSLCERPILPQSCWRELKKGFICDKAGSRQEAPLPRALLRERLFTGTELGHLDPVPSTWSHKSANKVGDELISSKNCRAEASEEDDLHGGDGCPPKGNMFLLPTNLKKISSQWEKDMQM